MSFIVVVLKRALITYLLHRKSIESGEKFYKNEIADNDLTRNHRPLVTLSIFRANN